MLSPSENDNVCDEGHALHDDGEGHEEANGAPHGAEVVIAVAILLVGEVVAFTGEGGTATVETVGVVDLFAAGLFIGVGQ